MITGTLVLSSIAVALAIGLVLFDRHMARPEDALVDEVERRLPRIQCAQCGYPGCRPYAAAIAADAAPLNLCPPGGEDTVRRLAKFLGRDADGLAAPTAAVVSAPAATAHVADSPAAGAGVAPAAIAGAAPIPAMSVGDSPIPAAGAGVATIPAMSVGVAPIPVVGAAPATAAAAVAANLDSTALIDEKLCIGCNLCARACPVDAIVGVQRMMHTVLSDHCTGCALCLPPCPVDCISLTPRHA